jgi:hypothetical protein
MRVIIHLVGSRLFNHCCWIVLNFWERLVENETINILSLPAATTSLISDCCVTLDPLYHLTLVVDSNCHCLVLVYKHLQLLIHI